MRSEKGCVNSDLGLLEGANRRQTQLGCIQVLCALHAVPREWVATRQAQLIGYPPSRNPSDLAAIEILPIKPCAVLET